jgi:hypothetical protein
MTFAFVGDRLLYLRATFPGVLLLEPLFGMTKG